MITFATADGSGIGDTNERLLPSCNAAKLIEGKVLESNISKADLPAGAGGLF